jgi:apolipoprotein N-acyltransferase
MSLVIAAVSWLAFAAAIQPVGFMPLALVGLAPWLAQTQLAGERGFLRRFLVGTWIYGVYHLQWVGEVMGWAGPVCLVLLGGLYGLFQVPLGLLLRYLVHRRRGAILFLAPFLFTANDILREWTIGGICWHTVGMAFARWNSVVQIADVARIWPLTFLAYAANAVIAAEIVRRRGGSAPSGRTLGWCAAAIALAFLALSAIGAWRRQAVLETLADGPVLAGVQGNVAQDEKLRDAPNTEYRHHLRHLELMRQAVESRPDVALIAWPETSLRPSLDDSHVAPMSKRGWPLDALLAAPRPGSGRSLSEQFADVTAKAAPRPPGPRYLVGVVARDDMPPGHYDEEGLGVRERNVALLLEEGPAGRLRAVDRYEKRKLVPCGEYLPLRGLIPKRAELRKNILDLVGYVPSMTPGEGAGLMTLVRPERDWRFAVNICFEIAYPELFRAARRGGAEWVVNISNDAWYGDSAELDLVHEHTMVRAIESRMSIFRVSNTGISTLIDPTGGERAVVEVDGDRKEVAGVLVARVPVGAPRPFYVEHGDVAAWIFLILAFTASAGVFFGGRPRAASPRD